MRINADGAKDFQRVKYLRHCRVGQAGGNVVAFPEKMTVRMRTLGAVFRLCLTRKNVLCRKTYRSFQIFRTKLKFVVMFVNISYECMIRCVTIYNSTRVIWQFCPLCLNFRLQAGYAFYLFEQTNKDVIMFIVNLVLSGIFCPLCHGPSTPSWMHDVCEYIPVGCN